MTAQSELEIKGNFLTHPFAELLAEMAAAQLNGSLRVSNKERKCVVYFKNGRVVFAVSNARSSRLFDTLLSQHRLTKDDLARIPNFENDFELTAFLKEKRLLTQEDTDELFSAQIESILIEVLSWRSGEWTFSYLARVRDGLEFDVDATKLLVEYARCLPVDNMLSRFRTLNERFARSEDGVVSFQLQPDETHVLSHSSEQPVTAASLLDGAGMSEAAVFHAIYTLWLGRLLIRTDWQPAFSAEKVRLMHSARLEIKREAKMPAIAEVLPPPEPKQKETPAAPEAERPREPEIELPVEQFLERVEKAETYYDILGVDPKAEIEELKKAYFALARKFHPDRYHAEGGAQLPRIQHAFSELAQAHETLKNPESRELYDYRMRKELADREKTRKSGDASSGQTGLQYAQAEEAFENGFSLLMDGETEAATPFLARAAIYAPKNARYRAYYGKALSADDKQRHKAEAEMQAAVKIDPNNQTFRILLAEFFIQHNLLKRAEGELNRLLANHPNNREAREMLAGLASVQSK